MALMACKLSVLLCMVHRSWAALHCALHVLKCIHIYFRACTCIHTHFTSPHMHAFAALRSNKVIGCRYFLDGVGGQQRVKELWPTESISCRCAAAVMFYAL